MAHKGEIMRHELERLAAKHAELDDLLREGFGILDRALGAVLDQRREIVGTG